MELILLADLIIVVVGLLLTRKAISKLSTRIFIWSAVFVVLILCEFMLINKMVKDYYSKQHYLTKKELSEAFSNAQKYLKERKQAAFANANLVFEGYPLKIGKIDKAKQYEPSAVDMILKPEYLRANSSDYRFVVVFDIQKQIKGQITAPTFNIFVQDPKMTFAFAGFDIARDGTISTKIPFRIYINSKNEMIYNVMVLKNVE